MSLFQQDGGALQQNTLNLMVDPTPIAVTASGAINPKVSGTYSLDKAGVAAMTLAAPNSGPVPGGDGTTIEIISSTANQHTLTATNLLVTGASGVSIATWPAAAGGSVGLVAYGGKWVVTSQIQITFT